MTACDACGHENRPAARFCERCGAPLGRPGSPDARRTVTMLFCDVVGSTELGASADPESVRRIMGRYFEVMRHTLERHGGTVEKFIGDAVMAAFGIPRLHEDDALRAVRAAVEMRARLEELNAELEPAFGVTLGCRIGVNTGEVVAGDPSAGEAFATGDAVNVAARLEQAAEPMQIVVGQSTYQLVRDAVDAAPLEPRLVKGKTDPLPTYAILGLRPGAIGRERRAVAPLVGRGVELQALRAALDDAVRTRAVRMLAVLGDACREDPPAR